MTRAYYRDTVTDHHGNAVTGASVRVTDPDTGADLTLYTTATLATLASNPLLTDSVGAFEFYLDSAQQANLSVSKSGWGTALVTVSVIASDTVFNVEDYGAAPGATAAVNTAAIQAAIDAAAQASIGYGFTRAGRGKVIFPSPGPYAINNTLDLCDKQGIIIDGGGYAAIDAQCTDKAVFEIIGSQDITLRYLSVIGHATNTPTMAFWTSRSTSTHGANSAHITFDHVVTSGEFTKCVLYALETESNFLKDCNFSVSGGGASAVLYIDDDNDLSLTPEHATLANTSYGSAMMRADNTAFLGTGTGIRSIYLRGSGSGMAFHNCYFYTSDTDLIEMDTGTGITLESNTAEGGGANGLKITYVAANGAYATIGAIDQSFTGADYTIYGDDSTILRNSVFVRCAYSLPFGVVKPIRLYQAEGCDFSGFFQYAWRAFDITFDGSFAHYCKFHLGPTNTITLLNGATLPDCIIDDSVDTGQGVLKLPHLWPQTDLKVGPAAATNLGLVQAIRRYTGTWGAGAIADGGVATQVFTAADVTLGDVVLVSMSLPLDKVFVTGLAGDGDVRVNLYNRSGGSYDPEGAAVIILVIDSAAPA